MASSDAVNSDGAWLYGVHRKCTEADGGGGGGGVGGGGGGQPGSLHTKVKRCLYSLAVDLPCFPFPAVSLSSRLAVRH